MKKILASLAALVIIGSSATSVVSCGPITFSKLMNRTVSTEIYRGTYKMPISNWSSAVTMQLEDSIILTNAEDTLLATDQHNNFEGDLADAWGSNTDQDVWYFNVRTNAFAGHWTALDNSGNQVDKGKIVPLDFFNAFRYIFNPNNMSQVVGIWQTVIKYGDELVQFLKDIRDDGTSNPSEPKPPHPLYDRRFTITDWDDHKTTVISNYYLDRAIMAFNLEYDGTPESATAAQKMALDDSKSLETILTDSFANGRIISSGDGLYDGGKPKDGEFNLAFHLSKPVPYFESFAAFLAFAPMPDISVQYHNFTASGANYGRATPEKLGYQTIYYSGAYVVSDYNPTLKIKMKQNKFYFNKKNIKVKELHYSYIGNVDVSRQRFYFETGDISEVNIQPTDLAGWNKYVGSDLQNPNFEGANLTSRPQAGTYAMIFNYQSTRDEPETNNSNIALAQRSVRGYIRYVFDRSKIASYYSKAMDTTSTSKMLRNNWTSKNLVVYPQLESGQPDKDYVEYLNEDYFDLSNSDTIAGWLNQALSAYDLTPESFDQWAAVYGTQEGDPEKSALSDGYDAFMRNDLLGALVFIKDHRATGSNEIEVEDEAKLREYLPLVGNYTPSAEAEKLRLIKEKVHEDLDQYGIGQATLTWLANGANATTMNNNVNDAIRTFNQAAGADSPVKFVVKASIDANDYMVQTTNGKFNVISNGWVPDYADPYTFIHTLVAGGDLESYTGFGRLFSLDTSSGEVKLEVNPGIPNSPAYEDLRIRVEAFTERVSKIDKDPENVNKNKRYQAFATIENFAMIESMIAIPLYFQYLDEPPFISYVNPFTRSTFTSGQAIYRFVGVEMIPRLWNHATFNQKKAEWEAEKMSYLAIYPDRDGNYDPNFDGKWNK